MLLWVCRTKRNLPSVSRTFYCIDEHNWYKWQTAKIEKVVTCMLWQINLPECVSVKVPPLHFQKKKKKNLYWHSTLAGFRITCCVHKGQVPFPGPSLSCLVPEHTFFTVVTFLACFPDIQWKKSSSTRPMLHNPKPLHIISLEPPHDDDDDDDVWYYVHVGEVTFHLSPFLTWTWSEMCFFLHGKASIPTECHSVMAISLWPSSGGSRHFLHLSNTLLIQVHIYKC